MSEIDVVIGDSPPFNPFSDQSNMDSFGGDYIGQFRIYEEASDGSGGGSLTPVSSSDADYWRTTHQSTDASEDMKLHIKRAKQSLAHHYQTKQKLNSKF